jgi:hypothetical protein
MYTHMCMYMCMEEGGGLEEWEIHAAQAGPLHVQVHVKIKVVAAC